MPNKIAKVANKRALYQGIILNHKSMFSIKPKTRLEIKIAAIKTVEIIAIAKYLGLFNTVNAFMLIVQCSCPVPPQPSSKSHISAICSALKSYSVIKYFARPSNAYHLQHLQQHGPPSCDNFTALS